MSAFMKPLNVVTLLIPTMALAVVSWRTYGPGREATRPPIEAINGVTVPASDITHSRGSGHVVLVEFSDFECQFCSRHTNVTGPKIVAELVNGGRLRQVFFNFPLPSHPRARKAAEAVECAANQGRFWEMHERLFQDFPAIGASHLLQHAMNLGLDQRLFGACLDGGDTAPQVQRHVQLGKHLGVTATPAFFIGTVEPNGGLRLVRRITGAAPFEQFSAVVHEVGSVDGALVVPPSR
jgi:protein-disulfide isomerase